MLNGTALAVSPGGLARTADGAPDPIERNLMTSTQRLSTVLLALAIAALPLPAFADACARVAHAATVHQGGSTAIQWLAPTLVGVVLGLAYRRSRRR
jgi:hypothetical protein